MAESRVRTALEPGPEIVVVSGLPRSGTSMMMAMLAAGGVEPASDGVRRADADNPRGYFELEAVKGLPGDQGWLPACRGRAVKVVSRLLLHLPAGHRYRVVFMFRDLGEVLASQRRMLQRAGRPWDPAEEPALAQAFRGHLARVVAWMDSRPEVAWQGFEHRQVLADPAAAARRLAGFLGRELDLAAAAAAVDPALHRQRREDLGPVPAGGGQGPPVV